MSNRPIPALSTDQVARFWSKVDVQNDKDCWNWTAGTYDGRRGRFTIQSQDYPAPRIAYFLSTGQPGSRDVCHTCDNPRCCNPQHLWAGSRGENNRDRADKGRSAPVKGESNPRAKLTEADVLLIRQLDGTCSALGERFNVHRSLINRIKLRKAWTHV